jgi:putative ABC transport system substrate-binding protein
MKRREFIAGLGAVAGCPTFARAQAQSQLRRIGALMAGSQSDQVQANFENALKEFGWISGRNVAIDFRWSAGDTDLTRVYAKELLKLKPDVMFALTNTAMAALRAENSSVPTVFAMVSDPVAMHYVESIARPGGTVTGFMPFEPSLGSKWISLLKEVSPKLDHVALIFNPEPGNNSASFRVAVDAVTPALGIKSVESPVGSSADIERLIGALGQIPNSGLIFLPDALTAARRKEFVALVARNRLPAIYPLRYFCTAGGLMSYGVDTDKLVRRATSYIDRILRGADPGQLPVQAPTEFELIINQKVAKDLGLEILPTLLVRADEVIE